MSSTIPDESGLLQRALLWWHNLGSWDVELDNSAALEAEAKAIDCRTVAMQGLRQARLSYDTRESDSCERATMPTVQDLKARLQQEHEQMKEALGVQISHAPEE